MSTETPNLTTSVDQLFSYAMQGDRADERRSNYLEALAILQFKVLVQQERTAVAQKWAAIATALLFAATIALVIVTS
jgi:hypothetical protein